MPAETLAAKLAYLLYLLTKIASVSASAPALRDLSSRATASARSTAVGQRSRWDSAWLARHHALSAARLSHSGPERPERAGPTVGPAVAPRIDASQR